MAGRALPISPYSPPKRHRPPETPRKLICFGSNNSNFKFQFGLCKVHVVLNGRSHVWRIKSDVKSESYEVSNSTPGSFKFKDKLEVVVSGGENGDEFVENVVPWWEEFPKRWTIVILCFSAFLLCNMDRVSSFYYYYY